MIILIANITKSRAKSMGFLELYMHGHCVMYVLKS